MHDHLFSSDPIEWQRIGHFQDVTLRLISERLLPKEKSGTTWLDNELISQLPLRPLEKPKVSYHLYVSPLNPGAMALVEEFAQHHEFKLEKKKYENRGQAGEAKDALRRLGRGDTKVVQILNVTDQVKELAECDHMLLYLTSQTWTRQEESNALAAELTQAMNSNVHVLLVHEMNGIGGQEARHGCEFKMFFSNPEGATPGDLIGMGIYSSIAVALKGGAWRDASMMLLAKEFMVKDIKEAKEAKESSGGDGLLARQFTGFYDVVSSPPFLKQSTFTFSTSIMSSLRASEVHPKPEPVSSAPAAVVTAKTAKEIAAAPTGNSATQQPPAPAPSLSPPNKCNNEMLPKPGSLPGRTATKTKLQPSALSFVDQEAGVTLEQHPSPVQLHSPCGVDLDRQNTPTTPEILLAATGSHCGWLAAVSPSAMASRALGFRPQGPPSSSSPSSSLGPSAAPSVAAPSVELPAAAPTPPAAAPAPVAGEAPVKAVADEAEAVIDDAPAETSSAGDSCSSGMEAAPAVGPPSLALSSQWPPLPAIQRARDQKVRQQQFGSWEEMSTAPRKKKKGKERSASTSSEGGSSSSMGRTPAVASQPVAALPEALTRARAQRRQQRSLEDLSAVSSTGETTNAPFHRLSARETLQQTVSAHTHGSSQGNEEQLMEELGDYEEGETLHYSDGGENWRFPHLSDESMWPVTKVMKPRPAPLPPWMVYRA
jgi:hypothetical protein